MADIVGWRGEGADVEAIVRNNHTNSPWFNLTKVLLINRKFVGTYAQCFVVFSYSY
jgi:hypothetical protein